MRNRQTCGMRQLSHALAQQHDRTSTKPRRVSLIEGSERIATLDIDQGRPAEVEESGDRDLPVDATAPQRGCTR